MSLCVRGSNFDREHTDILKFLGPRIRHRAFSLLPPLFFSCLLRVLSPFFRPCHKHRPTISPRVKAIPALPVINRAISYSPRARGKTIDLASLKCRVMGLIRVPFQVYSPVRVVNNPSEFISTITTICL